MDAETTWAMSHWTLLVLFMMTGLLSAVFRYALDWRGKKEDYSWFMVLWLLLIGLWWGLMNE